MNISRKNLFIGMLFMFTHLFFIVKAMEASPDLLKRKDYSWRCLNGPFGGGCTSICIDSADHNHILVCTKTGVNRSVNGGETWMPSGEGLMDEGALRNIRQAPMNPSVFYVTGGIRVTGDPATSIYRSTDGGGSWSYCGITDELCDVWVHETHNERLLLGGKAGLFLSTDSGDSWTPLDFTDDYYEFTSHPNDPDRIYAATNDTGISVSTDGGFTWENRGSYDAESYANSKNVSTRSIEAIYDGDLTIFSGRRWNLEGSIKKSTDEGFTWETVLSEPINRIKADPSNTDVLWATGGSYDWDPTLIFRSTDSGENWENSETQFTGMGSCLAVDPADPNRVYVGKIEDGLLITEDGGENWRLSHRYLCATKVSEIELHPSDEWTVLAGSRQRRKLAFSNSYGLNWSEITGIGGGYSQSAAYHPEDPSIILGGAKDLYRSTDGGNSWNPTNISGSASLGDVLFCRDNPNYVYAGLYQYSDTFGIWISSDTGQYFVRKHQDNVACMAVDPSDPAFIIARVYNGPTHSMIRSTDYGNSWNPLEYIGYPLAADPTFPGRYYMMVSQLNLCRTDDGGDTWTTGLGAEIEGDVLEIKVSPVDGTVYAAAEGLWFSEDAGQTWQQSCSGLSFPTLNQIALRVENQEENFYAGTFDSGLWKWMPIDEQIPDITLIQPDGGESLEAGQTYEITWEATDNEHILYADIFLSTDAGETWPIVVKGGHQNNGTYEWTIPCLNSDACRIRCAVYDPSWNRAEDESETDFSITCSYVTPSPTAFPTSTQTPATPTPAETAAPTFTPQVNQLNISLSMPSHHYTPGDICSLEAIIRNPNDPINWVLIFVVLDVYGEYWTAPSWEHFPEHLDYFVFGLPVGRTVLPVLNEFTWPDDAGDAYNLKFLATITDSKMINILSNIDVWDFGYSE